MNDSTTTPPPNGPRHARIEEIWNDAWKACADGEVYEFYVALAEVEISRFGSTGLPPNNDVARLDQNAAENAHLAHSRHFFAHVAQQAETRALMNSTRDFVIKAMNDMGQLAYKMLSVANGAVATGIVAFMGTQTSAGKAVPGGLLSVLILSAVGFFLTLLSGHAGVLLFQKPIKVLTDLSMPRISEERSANAIKELNESLKPARIVPTSFAYAATACLVGAFVVAALALSGRYEMLVP